MPGSFHSPSPFAPNILGVVRSFSFHALSIWPDQIDCLLFPTPRTLRTCPWTLPVLMAPSPMAVSCKIPTMFPFHTWPVSPSFARLGGRLSPLPVPAPFPLLHAKCLLTTRLRLRDYLANVDLLQRRPFRDRFLAHLDKLHHSRSSRPLPLRLLDFSPSTR